MRRIIELFRLALGGLRRSPLRVTLTALGVAIASGALVSMVGLALGLQAQAEEPFRRMELANRIDVYPPQSDGAKPAAVLDDAALARIAALPGVVLAYPDFRLSSVQISRGGLPFAAPAAAMPAEAIRLPFVRDALVAGTFLDRPDAAVLGVRLARQIGFRTPDDAVGQKLTLTARGLAPTAAGTFQSAERRIDVVVCGVWDPPGGRHGFTADAIVLPVDVIRSLPVGLGTALERTPRPHDRVRPGGRTRRSTG
jgi:hypothetical protein